MRISDWSSDVCSSDLFGFSMSACIGCHSCEVACAEQNGLPAGTVWRRVGEVEGGAFPDTRRLQISMSCNHCLDAACLNGCPTNAYEKLDNGVVAHHARSEEHTSELQSLMRISYAVFCLKKKK